MYGRLYYRPPSFILNTYSHFSLSSKSWDLWCLCCNVLGHGHVRQLRDAIHAQLKEEGMVLCDVIFERKKNYVSQQKLRHTKKIKYLLIRVLPVFDALVGWKACLNICVFIFFVFLLGVGRDFQVTCKILFHWSI